MTHKSHQIIKTNIKFYCGLKDDKDKLYGFVTKTNGSWRGCRETEPLKKIVFVDTALLGQVKPNTLYACSLIPMRNEAGFIAKTAKLLQFEASIITNCHKEKNIFTVSVKFGNKVIIYDPSSKERRKHDINKIANELRSRLDLANAHIVAEDFINNAFSVKQYYKQHLQHVSR